MVASEEVFIVQPQLRFTRFINSSNSLDLSLKFRNQPNPLPRGGTRGNVMGLPKSVKAKNVNLFVATERTSDHQSQQDSASGDNESFYKMS